MFIQDPPQFTWKCGGTFVVTQFVLKHISSKNNLLLFMVSCIFRTSTSSTTSTV